MIERTVDPLARIGGVVIDTPQLREALRKTGEPLGLVAYHVTRIEEAITQIVQEIEGAVEQMAKYQKAYGGPPHNAGLAQLGGSPLRSPGDFKVAVGRLVAQRCSAAGIELRQPDGAPGLKSIRELVDRARGLSLLALVQNWRSGSPVSDEPDEAA